MANLIETGKNPEFVSVSLNRDEKLLAAFPNTHYSNNEQSVHPAVVVGWGEFSRCNAKNLERLVASKQTQSQH